MDKNRFSRREWMALAAGAPLLAAAQGAAGQASGYVEILRPPDMVTAFLEKDTVGLARAGGRWTAKGIAVQAEVGAGGMPIRIEAPDAPLMRVRLRWKAGVPTQWRVLNDQWERSYGDLEWRGLLGERVLPWYFLAFDGQATHGYGVATGCSAFAFWQADAAGVSLWLDVRNGGGPVLLGQRTLEAATVRTRRGAVGESPFGAARRFCKMLCEKPLLPRAPVYGANNWYYTYGRDCSAAGIERDCDLLAELAPSGNNRPYMVIDDGWSLTNTAGPWERGNAGFPDMPGLARAMKRRGVSAGIWMRPLYTAASVPERARLRPRSPSRHIVMDPTVPEMMETVNQDIRRMVSWGFDLVKHDFTCYDLLGRWGFAMGAELTDAGWRFADRSQTTAEVTLALYRTIREAAGKAYVIGCNTFGHLAAGLVELQRTGDDTSGREFHRTRRMGVNTLAFRGPQHGAFFGLDADCAPVTAQVPWELSARWLDLVARSGTALFVSADPAVTTGDVRQAVKKALAAASVPRALAEPLDWMETTTPGRWRIDGKTVEYDWYGAEGGTPFPR